MAYYVDGGVVPEFARTIVEFAEAWGARLTEQRIRVYAQALGHVEWDALLRAFSACVAECRTFPTVAEILRHAQPSSDDAALLAWTGLCRAVSRVGSWTSVDVADGAAAQALVDVFGSWAAFCAVEEGPELALKRQQFLAAYRQARRGSPPPRRLDGLCAASGPSGGILGRIDGATVTTSDRALESGRERPRLSEGTDAEAVEGARRSR